MGHCLHGKKTSGLSISVFSVKLSTEPFGKCLDIAVVSISLTDRHDELQ